MTTFKKSFEYGEHTVTIETGEIARQTDAAVIVDMGGTVLMATVVGKKEADPSIGFFPLTINYMEKAYAAGKIPGGFFKREGRPSEKETLISRLIDRPLRPLFPKGFSNAVQVVVTLISLNPEVDTEVPAMIAASAAVSLSGIPFSGPIGAAKVGYKDGEYLLNPNLSTLESSDLDLTVAGTKDAVLMVESEANILTEEVMLGAVVYGHEQSQVVINAISELAQQAAKPTWDWQAEPEDTALLESVKAKSEQGLVQAYQTADKLERQDKVSELRKEVVAALVSDDVDSPVEDDVKKYFSKVEKEVVRQRIISGERRIDGRENDTVRQISARVGLLPRVHGSALFTRGETQAIVTATLGTQRDAQTIDALEGERKEHFMLHYNFPPYCVGEVGMVGSPKRREIGHGRLAKRGVQALIPDTEEFPYVIRLVSEITESNGSSSMASVCGSSLAMMDAGVPLKAPVAGIAMGLVKESDDYVVLSDILGDEDHLGDMDFKVAGTETGITALQMDIKIQGITREIMQKALDQAKSGRMFILEEMNKALSVPREEMSEYAPRYVTLKINPDKIRDVIGKGGATIRALTEETGATIDIDDTGMIKIASADLSAAEDAKKRIEALTAEIEVGAIYEGKVTKIMDFGAFVAVLPGKEGLVHISQIADHRVEKVTDELSEGDDVTVKVLELDRQGRVRLSMKAVNAESA